MVVSAMEVLSSEDQKSGETGVVAEVQKRLIRLEMNTYLSLGAAFEMVKTHNRKEACHYDCSGANSWIL